MFLSLRRIQWRRWNDSVLKKFKQLSLLKRISLTAIFILSAFYFLASFFTSSFISESEKCLNERLLEWTILEKTYAVAISRNNFGFTGNGFIGMGGDGELRLKATLSRVLSVRSAFFPFITAKILDSEFSESFVTDFRDGTIIAIRCYHINDQCICTTQRIYAHRRRPHLLIQEFRASNPSTSDIEIKLMFTVSKLWNHIKRDSVADPLYTRYFESDGAHTLAAITCNEVPETVTVGQGHDIFIRFLCLISYVSPLQKNKDEELKVLEESIVKELALCKMMEGNILYREHSTAWKRLNIVTFGISKSLAPNALNAAEINSTRHMLLSNTRDPLLEIGFDKERKKAASSSLNKMQMCYTGHSTLLVPSRLWKRSSNMNDMIETMDIWLLTLEKRGCGELLKIGASGLAEAFVLSLLASKFSNEHLEVNIDLADLQREIVVNDIAYSPNTRISISILLNDGNRPYFMISSNSQVFACNAACLNSPVAVGPTNVHIPVKITVPATPILYISHNKNHLEQLRGTIHVVELADAPAHEHGLIALHKHGHRLGGLPALFWLMLGALVTVFHLFLFKLLYSEWKKGDTTPYNYYSRQRYFRSH
ncbi:unnamed protein product [Thelazia callipaeda]|uniref:L-type lectin-like domain-containing protein n=1 Tax=Thelazia callipaeda TaxID=103827 RepID=A0A0N5CV77_THECL|nr:unnamed protein product [Thelazia callipaeda]